MAEISTRDYFEKVLKCCFNKQGGAWRESDERRNKINRHSFCASFYQES